jgi:hypothetical protein
MWDAGLFGVEFSGNGLGRSSVGRERYMIVKKSRKLRAIIAIKHMYKISRGQ